MGRYAISISVTARYAAKPQGLPLTLPRLCRVLIFVGSQVKARSGRTKSQVVSGAISVRVVGVRFQIACGAPRWFGFQPVCSMNSPYQGFLFTSTQHPPRHGSKNPLSAFDWRAALRAWNHLTNCCSTFRARPYTGRPLRCATCAPLNKSVIPKSERSLCDQGIL